MQNEDYGHFDEPRGHEDIDLAQFDDDFAHAEVEEREFETIPDGKYQVNVERVELTRAQTSGNPMLKWTLRILAPKFRGRLLWRNNVMATRENIKWLKTDLHTCGLNLDKLSELPTNLEKLINVKLEITKRTRCENENVYINRRIVLEDGGDEYDSAARNAPVSYTHLTEPGLNSLDVFQVPIRSWEELLAACGEIAEGKHPFKTVILDTVDNAYRMCSDYILSLIHI